MYRKSSINLPGGLIISSPFEEGLIETGGLFEMGGLLNLKTAMVSVLHKELDCKVEKLKSGADWWAPAQIQEVLGHAAEDRNQIRSSTW